MITLWTLNHALTVCHKWKRGTLSPTSETSTWHLNSTTTISNTRWITIIWLSTGSHLPSPNMPRSNCRILSKITTGRTCSRARLTHCRTCQTWETTSTKTLTPSKWSGGSSSRTAWSLCIYSSVSSWAQKMRIMSRSVRSSLGQEWVFTTPTYRCRCFALLP